MIHASTLAQALHARTQRNDLADSATQKLQAAATGTLSEAQAQGVAKDFESLFITQMMEYMFSGDSLGESLFGSEESEEIYQSMMVEQYAKKIADSGGIGIASHISKTLIERSNAARALLSTQEVSDEHASQPTNNPYAAL